MAASTLLALTAPAHATELTVDAGRLQAVVRDDPWRVAYVQRGGTELVEERGIGVRGPAGWSRAVRAEELRQDGAAVLARIELDDGGRASVRIAPAGDGIVSVQIDADAQSLATGVEFAALQDEHFYGTGERSDAVDRRGRETENYVADGPFVAEDREYVKASTPPWAQRDRDDATYYPVPWLLSSRGYGVLVDEDATSRFRVASRPRRPLERRSRRLAAAPARLRRADARGGARRGSPPPSVASRRPRRRGGSDRGFRRVSPMSSRTPRSGRLSRRSATPGAPVSAAETQMHFLPCGAHRGIEADERERTAAFHREGLARLVYFNPSLCASYLRRVPAGGRRRRASARRGRRAVHLARVRWRRRAAGLHPGAARPVRLHASGHRGLLRRAGPRRPSTSAPTAGWRTSARARRRW